MRERDEHHTSWVPRLTAEIIQTIHGWPQIYLKKLMARSSEVLRTVSMGMRNQHGIDSS
jgi:hypothetical protein